jgi:hypothetical protein
MESAGDLNSVADLNQTLVVIMLYGILWSFGFIGVAICFWKSRQETDKRTPALNLKKKQAALTKSKEDIQRYLVSYIDEIFPAVFQPKLPLTRLWTEIKRHHRYFIILSSNSTYDVRMLTTIQLLTVQAMLMFVLAVCYDLQFPQDDGSCETALTKNECVHMKAFFDSEGPCAWTSDPRAPAPDHLWCIYNTQRNSSFNFKVISRFK